MGFFHSLEYFAGKNSSEGATFWLITCNFGGKVSLFLGNYILDL